MERIDITKSPILPHGQSEPHFDKLYFGKLKVDTVNALEGDYQGYECKKCKNKGFVAVLMDDGDFYTKPCHWMPKSGRSF